MITLTTQPEINAVLGGTTKVAYDRFVLTPITLDPRGATVTSGIRLTSTASADMQPIAGTLNINLVSGILQIEVPQLNFLRRVSLNASQISSIQAVINSAQNSLEQGLINLGVVSGTQGAGV